ncbi:MAG: dynamin-like GTPase family protein, partial [Cyanobacteria bacterium J06573_2]
RCQNLKEQVDSLTQFLQQEPYAVSCDVNPTQTSLGKVISPRFEIVFAGAFSAGKSMLINALLERELLYSAEGHATGTECKIEYAHPENEKVVLTFLSETEVREQVFSLCERLGLHKVENINREDAIELLRQGSEAIILSEGGESKSERAKQAKALILLLSGYVANRQHIHTINNATYSMEEFNFNNLKEAAGYARRGSNSAVLKRIEYYCNHQLLQDGNVIIDTPGIDAPVEKDAQLTYEKIQHPDTSAVVCVLKPASMGDMTKAETQLLEVIKNNPGIRDRVFYVFNRIDETWYNDDLKQRLNNLIDNQFQNENRVFQTSGLLGFYGSQIKQASQKDRFGLDSIFVDKVQSVADKTSDEITDKKQAEEATPQFVYEFLRYCTASGKLPTDKFRISVNNFETQNQNYVRILSEQGTLLINQLIQDSGVDNFKTAITRYLTQEKRPELFKNLAEDLKDICIPIKKYYQKVRRELDSQPQEIEAMKAQELQLLNQQLQQVGNDFREHIAQEVNQIVTNACEKFESDFNQLRARMIHRLDELLDTFSVADTYKRATLSHPRNATAPLIGILVEALYYLANQLEDILVEYSEKIVLNFFQRLNDRIRKTEYYKQLYHLLGNDGGLEQELDKLEKLISLALQNAARVECDRFVRESPRFYDEGTFSIYQFRQTLKQTSQTFDCQSMVEAEPAIKQLLKLDFEPKVSQTIRITFRQTINQSLKTQLLPMVDIKSDQILQQYPRARAYLEQTLAKEAEEKVAQNQRLSNAVDKKIASFNQSVSAINGCLRDMQLYDYLLPVIGSQELDIVDNTSFTNDDVAEILEA